jgi:arylsulfatase A-like enzyme
MIAIACQVQEEAVQTEESPQPRFKNIVLLIGDDHSANVVGAYGNDLVRTPNLDRMASSGMRFEYAYANAPMCSASRQSFLTGLYPHAAGVTLLRTPLDEEKITIADHLGRYGYTSAIIGKNHFNDWVEPSNHGFDYRVERKDYRAYRDSIDAPDVADSIATRPPWKPFRDHARRWLNADMLPGDQYDSLDIGTWYARQASAFLEAQQDKPFLLWVGFHEPHSPFNFPPEYRESYQPENMPLPQGSPEDDRWVPQVFRDLTEAERRGIVASYYTSVEYLDKNVGMILDKIDQLGLGDSTLVIYIGDHGYLLNDHKRFEKHMMWEPAIRAPLIVRGGEHFKPGSVSVVLTEYVDLVPTMLEAVGVPPIHGLQGKSLMPVLTGHSDEHKDYVFSEFLADNKAMVRDKRFKYIFSSGKRDLAQGYETGFPAPGITHRLYDVSNDPDETTNLFNDPDYRQEAERLQQVMLEWFAETHPAADSVAQNWNDVRKLSAYCEPPEGAEGMDAK